MECDAVRRLFKTHPDVQRPQGRRPCDGLQIGLAGAFAVRNRIQLASGSVEPAGWKKENRRVTDSHLEILSSKIRPDSRITVLTGAGVSAASGVPTFRGPDGLWKQHRPESIATAEAFRRDPKFAWEWYDWRRQ